MTDVSGVRTEPPVSAEECEEAGKAFGRANRAISRFQFEEELVKRLAGMEGLFGGAAGLDDACLAAFDRAAWDAWEEGKPP